MQFKNQKLFSAKPNKQTVLKVIPFLILFSVLSCKDVNSLNGQYVLAQRISDPKTPSGGGLIEEFEIKGNTGYIKYFGTTFKAESNVEGNTIIMDTKTGLGVLKLSILKDGTLKGEGWIAGLFKKMPTDKTE